MKTKLLLCLLFVGSLQQSFAQYCPLLVNSSYYIMVASWGGPTYYWINPGVDTVIGSYTYKKFTEGTSITYIREDLSTKRVYRSINNADVLLFDFGMQVGNTVVLGNGNTYKLNSISFVNVNGGQRRVFNLVNLSQSFFTNETWIEGVGNKERPFTPSWELFSDPTYYVHCSYQNGIAIYNQGLADGGTPTDCPIPALATVNPSFPDQNLKVFPNPFAIQTTITLNRKLENATMQISNALGQIVKEIKNIDGDTIILNRDNLLSGVYFINLSEDNKLIQTKKIIISK